MRLFAPIAAAALLAACAPPATTPPAPPVASSPRQPDAPPSTIAERDTCNAQPASGLIGQPASAANAERARQLAGAKIVRILRFDAIVTMEYAYGRLNVIHDAGGRIQAIRCG